MDPLDDSLPRGVALAWGVAANPQRGPKRELNIERIVEAAVEIADAQGLGAVSMSSVATTLGFTTMSLYRYVTAKDDLILLMQETGIGLPPLNITETEEWRVGLTRWYRAILDVYLAHPWLLDIPITAAPNTPNNLAWLDSGLAVLEGSAIDASARISAVLLLSGHSRWEAEIARGSLDGSEDSMPDGVLASLITAEQFPHLHPAIQGGTLAGDDSEFGLSRILDGLDTYMQQLSAGRSPVAPEPLDPAREFAKDERVKKAKQSVKDAESRLREARQREREAVARAREHSLK